LRVDGLFDCELHQINVVFDAFKGII